MEINRKVTIPFVGGNIVLMPEYEFTNEKGELIKLDPRIQVTGIGKLPFDITPELIDAIVVNHNGNKTFRQFMDKVRKFQTGDKPAH